MKSWGADDWIVFLIVASLFASCWADSVGDWVVYRDCLKSGQPVKVCKELKE